MDGSRSAPRLLVAALLWLVAAFALSLPLLQRTDQLDLTGDDAMRMVEVRDFLAGQDWFDTSQHRENTPFGAPMHWSRLIDAPIAGLITALRPVLGMAAEAAATVVWPLLLLAVFTVLLLAISDRLGGPRTRIPVALIAIMAMPVCFDFRPGSVDHHNVQTLLTLGSILATLSLRGWGSALLAGLLAATALAIGIEGLPMVLVQLLVMPLLWVFDPMRYGRLLGVFAASFALGTVAHLLAAVPVSSLFVPHCDALSWTYASGAALYGLAVAAALALARNTGSAWLRFAALAGFGAIAAGLALWISPNCLRGPYGDLDANLMRILLAPIGEAMPLWEWLLPLRPQLAIVVLPVAGLVALVVAVASTRGEERRRWLLLGAFVVAATLVMLLQVRGTRLASIVTLPASAWLIARGWQRFQAAQTLRAAAGFALLAVPFAGMLHWQLASLAFSRTEAVVGNAGYDSAYAACTRSDSYGRLAQLPPSRIVAYMIIGHKILYTTQHQVLASGYHRNQQGLKDEVTFFGGSEAAALDVVRRRGLEYLVTCRGISPEDSLDGLAPFKGFSWSWLTPVSGPDEPIQIYRISLPS